MHVRWAIIVALSRKALSMGNVRRASERGGGFERSGAQAILIITYYGGDESSGPRGYPWSTSFPTIKRPEQTGNATLAISPVSSGHTCSRGSYTRRNAPGARHFPLLYLTLISYSVSLLERGVQRRLNRNATRVLTFYSPKTIDRYRHGKYITPPMPGSLGELLRLIHTGRRCYPAGFPRLTP